MQHRVGGADIRFQLFARTGHPAFLDLPWSEPLEAWDHDRLVEIPRGLHRHVVKFVQYDEGLYVLKELPRRYAKREYEFLRHLAEEGVPVVKVVGLVTHRVDATGEPLSAVLITRHLEHSLPYRLLFARRHANELREPMLGALVDLLVRIHLVGFMWNDCSLSNTLFRRDAGRLAAYVVDVETGELHDELTDGQRSYDVDLAIERCAGELFDLQASGLVPDDIDPGELADELRTRYDELWHELTREAVFAADERHLIDERLRRINELGYDVGELELIGDDDGATMRLRLHVVEPARHERMLRELTGIVASPQQARALLQDIRSFGAWLRSDTGIDLDEATVARRWFEQSWRGVLEQIPDDVALRREPAELFVGAIDHWHARSREAGQDADLFASAREYGELLRDEPDERVVGRTMVDESVLDEHGIPTEPAPDDDDDTI